MPDRLIVTGTSGRGYVIEPARYRLGLSRVEQVDVHLAEVTRARRWQDVDDLLDARLLYATNPNPAPARPSRL